MRDQLRELLQRIGAFFHKDELDDDLNAEIAAHLEMAVEENLRRGMTEKEARRQAAAANAKPLPREYQGPKGPEPTRYGDWERKGIASDF